MGKTWMAKWIQDSRFASMKPLNRLHKETRPIHLEHPAELRNQHILYRKKCRLDSVPTVANLAITADDYYKLYVNGQFVTQGPAQGYPTRYYYNEVDISAFLKVGVNVIAVHVYYQGLVNRAMNSGDLRQGLIAELYADDRLVLVTDQTWKYIVTKEFGQGEVIGYDTQFLENVDSRLSHRGWVLPEFDDEEWLTPWEGNSAGYGFVLQPTPPLSVYTKRPVQVTRLESGRFLIDFGSELTGSFTMKARGKRGQSIEIRCGEELDKAQSVRYHMRCNCTYQEFWTLSGEVDTLEFYDYKSFRYVEVIGPDTALLPESFAAVIRHYPYDDMKCRFESSDGLLNDIWAICCNGVKYGSQETYVDCPSREKGQYLGDNTIITHAHAYLSGDLRLYRKALEEFAHSATVCPGLMAVVPGNTMQEIADFSLQWPTQLWRYYEFSGDIDFLKDMLPTLDGLLAYFEQYEDSEGLLIDVFDKWNLVDWPENLRDDYDFPLTRPVTKGCHNVVNAFYYSCLATAKTIKTELGIPVRERLSEFRAAFIRRFYDGTSKLFVDAHGSKHSSLHSNVLPLLFELAPDESAPYIVELVRDKGLSCGVYMAYFVLKALAKANEYELMYELLRNETERSWVNMLREGATTCFEAWGKDQKWNTSLCHPWASAPIPVLIEDVLGLKPGKPGWQEIRFNPHLPAALQHATLSITLPSGRIRVECRQGEEPQLTWL